MRPGASTMKLKTYGNSDSLSPIIQKYFASYPGVRRKSIKTFTLCHKSILISNQRKEYFEAVLEHLTKASLIQLSESMKFVTKYHISNMKRYMKISLLQKSRPERFLSGSSKGCRNWCRSIVRPFIIQLWIFSIQQSGNSPSLHRSRLKFSRYTKGNLFVNVYHLYSAEKHLKEKFQARQTLFISQKFLLKWRCTLWTK